MPEYFDVNGTRQRSHKGFKTSQLIAHAAGVPGSGSYTPSQQSVYYSNSLESLNRSYACGYRQIELDLQKTSDGHLVAVHDWPDWHLNTAEKSLGIGIPTLNEFLTIKPINKVTPIGMDAINNWFSTNTDAVLVVDKTQDFELLASTFNHTNRMLVETFSPRNFALALDAGLPGAMLSMHGQTGELPDESLLKFIDEWKITRVVAPMNFIDKEGIGQQLKERGVCLFLYSTDNPKMMLDGIERGAFGFYTDSLMPDTFATDPEQHQLLAEKCT